jgi:hypothetical protein
MMLALAMVAGLVLLLAEKLAEKMVARSAVELGLWLVQMWVKEWVVVKELE